MSILYFFLILNLVQQYRLVQNFKDEINEVFVYIANLSPCKFGIRSIRV